MGRRWRSYPRWVEGRRPDHAQQLPVAARGDPGAPGPHGSDPGSARGVNGRVPQAQVDPADFGVRGLLVCSHLLIRPVLPSHASLCLRIKGRLAARRQPTDQYGGALDTTGNHIGAARWHWPTSPGTPNQRSGRRGRACGPEGHRHMAIRLATANHPSRERGCARLVNGFVNETRHNCPYGVEGAVMAWTPD